MEIKYQILTQDETGVLHNVGNEADVKTAKQLTGILISGQDPNKLVDIVLHPIIKK